MILFAVIVSIHPRTPSCAWKVGRIAVDHLVPAESARRQKIERVGLNIRREGWKCALPVPNDDRITPPDAATFSMIMLATTAEGDAYTFTQYDEMYKNCGFSHNEIHRLEQSPEAVILSRR